ncbi:MAG: hypothetical protein M3Z96_02925 [Pseudomonadota bacterium]|nr:hypothetical protein [Pseudomonadota bacterium]
MREQGWRRFGLYCWDQGPGLPGDRAGRFAPVFELVFHFNLTGRKPNKTVPGKFAAEAHMTTMEKSTQRVKAYFQDPNARYAA